MLSPRLVLVATLLCAGCPPESTKITGHVMLNHQPLPSGTQAWVQLRDGESIYARTVALVKASADGSFSVPVVNAGTYWLSAWVDLNHDGTPDPDPEDPNSPRDAEVLGGPVTQSAAGVELDALTVQPLVSSVRTATEDGGWRFTLSIHVLRPHTGAGLGDATVTASDGTHVFTLEPRADMASIYEYQSDEAPIDGTYTFTVTEATHYPSPLVSTVTHHPLAARPAITSPADGQAFGALGDVTVTWSPLPEADRSRLAVTQEWTEVLESPDAATPLTIPAATFTAGKSYTITVTSIRYVYAGSMRSDEEAEDQVTISF